MIRSIARWWRRFKPSLNPCARIPGWKAAQDAERRARLRNDTKSIGRALRAKRAALHGNLRGVA